MMRPLHIIISFLLTVIANQLGCLSISYLMRQGMDDGLPLEEAVAGFVSWPSLAFAAGQTTFLFVVSFRFLSRTALWLPAVSAVIAPYYYVMFFSYNYWGNVVEPWLDAQLSGFSILGWAIYFVALFGPYAAAFFVQWAAIGRRRPNKASISTQSGSC